MKRLTLALVLILAGPALAQFRLEVQLPSIVFPSPPVLVEVEPGIQVVSDYDDEVFFVDNYYWNRRGDHWYRTNRHNGVWVEVIPGYVPPRLTFYERGRFRRWRGSDDQRREWNNWRERHEDRRQARERYERYERDRQRLEREQMQRERERDREARERYEREQRHERWEDRRDDRRDDRRGPPPTGYVVPPPQTGRVHGSAPAGDPGHGAAPATGQPQPPPGQPGTGQPTTGQPQRPRPNQAPPPPPPTGVVH